VAAAESTEVASGVAVVDAALRARGFAFGANLDLDLSAVT
jgi:hypothetical protein